MEWTPTSWQSKNVKQQPTYPDAEELERVVDELSRLPPLVTSWEVESLKAQLAEAAAGKRFLLQGGDCAEVFDECESSVIANKLKILLQMSLVLVHGGKRPVIRVGRFAGQYAKPRSSDLETRDGVTLPSYRGDLVNGFAFTEASRRPDPQRLLRGYERASLTLNFIRSLVDGGFADLHHPEYWDLDFVEHSPMAAEYRRIIDTISDSIQFMETLAGRLEGAIQRVDFFTSHEGLHLLYEQAQTRRVPHRPGWYNLATHMPWIGMRTADLDGAHVEYCRGIQNPIGVKVGPSMTPEWLAGLLVRLNPRREPGRLVLIHRFGHDRIADCLPPLIEIVREAEQPVVWCCDPMHGNTQKTQSGIKTRRFDDILAELEQAFDIHRAMGSYLGGVHCELTGEDVTECTGGARGLDEESLTHKYTTFVDPRLNCEQALEIAMLVARRMAQTAERPAAVTAAGHSTAAA
ncbi:MAG: 3-deoxy-7-phosphoheptulonate synthase class II [Acidobacteria bacterium]|nr:MAG: 3-deoxy-7-phosphoheptulonate synthase class II [Acidobacteriota bacterium]